MFFQNKTAKLLMYVAMNTLILVLAASCSKAPTGVRAQMKGPQTTTTTTSQATQAAASNQANYTISTITVPQSDNNGGFTVDVGLQMPNGEYLPVTTKHQANSGFSQGTYSDSKTGMQVLIQANCSAGDCSKYTLLVTVSKNSQNLYQNFAVSFANDCKFYLIASSNGIGAFYSSLNAAETANSNLSPANDIDSCQ